MGKTENHESDTEYEESKRSFYRYAKSACMICPIGNVFCDTDSDGSPEKNEKDWVEKEKEAVSEEHDCRRSPIAEEE